MLIRLFLVSIFYLSYSSAITNSIYDVATYVDKKNFYFSGKFYYYDFANSPAHYDFIYETYTGEVLQLRGNDSTSDDLFGWKEIDIVLPTNPLYYFVYLGDFDDDGDSRFDWVLVHVDKKIAYKLIGKSLSDTFVWSAKLPVALDIEGDFVFFEKTFKEEEPSEEEIIQPDSTANANGQNTTNNTTSTESSTVASPNIPTTTDNGSMPPAPPL